MSEELLMDEFWGIIAEIKDCVARSLPSTNQQLADSYAIAGAVDVFKKYFLVGEYRWLEDAMRRLEGVCNRQSRDMKTWAKVKLPRLREIAERMTAREREATLSAQMPVVAAASSSVSRPLAPACDLLVVAALHDPELTSFLARLGNVQNNQGRRGTFIAGATYYTGILENRDEVKGTGLRVVAVFQNRMGMTDCSVLTATAIEAFHPRVAAMTGVTAGREKMHVKLNDLLIPNAVLTCDTGKHSEHGFQREPLWTEVNDRIVQRVRSRGGDILQTLAKRISTIAQPPLEIPAIHTEVMACGSAVVDHAGMMDQIAGVNRKIVGVDMESYAFLRAAKLVDERLPAFVVKGVMDLGADKSDQEKDRAAFWAASFLASFVSAEFGTLISDDPSRQLRSPTLGAN